jgi:hypothetical protein
VVVDPGRDNPHWLPPPLPGRALIGASGSYQRKSFARFYFGGFRT